MIDIIIQTLLHSLEIEGPDLIKWHSTLNNSVDVPSEGDFS